MLFPIVRKERKTKTIEGKLFFLLPFRHRWSGFTSIHIFFVIASGIFSALQSYCSRIAVVLVSSDTRQIAIRLEARVKYGCGGQCHYLIIPGCSIHCGHFMGNAISTSFHYRIVRNFDITLTNVLSTTVILYSSFKKIDYFWPKKTYLSYNFPFLSFI